MYLKYLNNENVDIKKYILVLNLPENMFACLGAGLGLCYLFESRKWFLVVLRNFSDASPDNNIANTLTVKQLNVVLYRGEQG